MSRCSFQRSRRPYSPAVAWTTRALLNLAQILNASAGVLVMAPASRLAVLWFGENERVLATAVCSTASGLGITVGFSRFGAAPRGRG